MIEDQPHDSRSHVTLAGEDRGSDSSCLAGIFCSASQRWQPFGDWKAGATDEDPQRSASAPTVTKTQRQPRCAQQEIADRLARQTRNLTAQNRASAMRRRCTCPRTLAGRLLQEIRAPAISTGASPFVKLLGRRVLRGIDFERHQRAVRSTRFRSCRFFEAVALGRPTTTTMTFGRRVNYPSVSWSMRMQDLEASLIEQIKVARRCCSSRRRRRLATLSPRFDRASGNCHVEKIGSLCLERAHCTEP